MSVLKLKDGRTVSSDIVHSDVVEEDFYYKGFLLGIPPASADQLDKSIILDDNTAYLIRVEVVANGVVSGDFAGWTLTIAVRRVEGVSFIFGQSTTDIVGHSSIATALLIRGVIDFSDNSKLNFQLTNYNTENCNIRTKIYINKVEY